jgi:hypothetical protein
MQGGIVMPKYLVVANQTVSNPRLISELQALCRKDSGAEFDLLVPATPVRNLLFRRGTDEKAETVARKRISKAKALFAQEGITLNDADVGSGDPIAAVEQRLQARDNYAAVIISTLPGESSQWLRIRLPQTIESTCDVPVYHVESPAAWTYGP